MSFQIKWHPDKTLHIFFLLIISSLISSLVGCSFPSKENPQGQNSFEVSESGQTLPVKINFNLHLPSEILEEERIVIEILDEVSGLPYYKDIFDLTKEDDLTYSTEMSFPMGAVIKYRYSKIGDSVSTEANGAGNPVRYRLFHAINESSVNDHIHTWATGTSFENTGRLTGILLNANTKNPIPDILVSAAGQLTFTDTNGKFTLDNLSPTIHNVVFYAMDGKYQTFQQEAQISAGQITPANVNLVPNRTVNLTFQVDPPEDALGAPIFIAGNILQLGNTFSDLLGSMSVRQSKMPQLTLNEDGTYSIKLSLYTGTYLRYKFTLGDGYWNSEQEPKGGSKLRQLVVPSQDTTINLTIDSWRSSEKAPITFQIQGPQDDPPNANYFIQLKGRKWTEPIPLWPIGNNNYLYILYSPLDEFESLGYLICRTENCVTEEDFEDAAIINQVQPTDEPQTVTLNPELSPNPSVNASPEEVIEAYVPNRGDTYQTMIEITPHLKSTNFEESSLDISKLSEINASTIIFTPQWFFDDHSAILTQRFGSTPLLHEITSLLNTTKSAGFSISLFPQIGPVDSTSTLWESNAHPASWWHSWFNSYSNFVLNYANIAEISNADHLIIGGKFMLPTFKGGTYYDGTISDVPSNSDEIWQDLIAEIRQTFTGELLWATNIHHARDPLPEFINEFDGIYLLVDSPLATNASASFDEINWEFINVIDSLIYEVYRSTGLPITIGLGYPSVDGAALGCDLLGTKCINDGIFSINEVGTIEPEFQEQSLIYNAIFPVLTSREWITGVSIRGYNPSNSMDQVSSSIAKKPAYQVINYWFSGLRPNGQ